MEYQNRYNHLRKQYTSVKMGDNIKQSKITKSILIVPVIIITSNINDMKTKRRKWGLYLVDVVAKRPLIPRGR